MLGVGYLWNVFDICVLMGVLMGMVFGFDKGCGEVDKDKWIFVVIGDFIFLYMGMQGLFDMVYNKGNVMVLLFDNCVVGMIGGQDNLGNGCDIYGEVVLCVDFVKLVVVFGVKEECIYMVNLYELLVLFKIICEEVKVLEVLVIIIDQFCVLIKDYYKLKFFEVIDDKCIGCGNCIDVGCLVIYVMWCVKEVKLNGCEVDFVFVCIESLVCIGCMFCVQFCVLGVIVYYVLVLLIKLVSKGCGV